MRHLRGTDRNSQSQQPRSFPAARIGCGRTALRQLAALALVITRISVNGAQAQKTGEVDYSAAVQRFEAIVREELTSGISSGVTVALVDNQRIVYTRGFGFADKGRRIPAASDTVYRAGSISKLFTALAAMQLVEQERLDIDQPITHYDADFRIVIPFENAKPITLRQLMCHRAGMIREAPVGSYFDASEPGTARTVASLASCVLVHPPDTKTKYSNSGVTIVGWIVEKVSKTAFEQYQQKHVLDPIGMHHSGWRLEPKLKQKLATGYLSVADGNGGYREMRAPQFEFGILPAGNLYTTAEDLARFLMFLFAEGRTDRGPLIRPETLAQMFTPQLTQNTNGFGLGFSVGNFRRHKTVSHMGAVYGFTSSLTAIPGQKIGAVVLCNDDIAAGPVRKLSSAALSLMLEAKLGETLPAPPPALKLRPEELAAFSGDFESESFWAEIQPGDGLLEAVISNQSVTLAPTEPLKFEGSGRLVDRSPFLFERDSKGQVSGFTAMGQQFRRVAPNPAQEIPAEWKKFLGTYGPGFIPLIISIKHGHLCAMTENEFDYRLTPVNQAVFKMPPGLYTDEHLVFQMDANGKVHSAVLANMPLRRRGGR
ncbi:MAG: beta-lactamase family protein [Verrucomicrobia bacterium]|nr:beta-lactamase family protein [Verrucomicrobiota bacterium]